MLSWCGIGGNISRAWKLLTGSLPRFEACCEEHDWAYITGEDRAWSDSNLRRCIAGFGYPVTAWVFWAAVRMFGWWKYRQLTPR